MHEPGGPLETLGGAYSALVAGFAGALVRLSVAAPMSPIRMVCALAGGALTAAYVGPAFQEYYGWSAKAADMVAFFVGIGSMVILPGLLHAIELAAADPVKTWQRWKEWRAEK